MKTKKYKEEAGKLGVILNTFDVDKLTKYMETSTFFVEPYKKNFINSDRERRIMYMCFMIIDNNSPSNVYPNTKKKAKELIQKKVMEERFTSAKNKVDKKLDKEKGE